MSDDDAVLLEHLEQDQPADESRQIEHLRKRNRELESELDAVRGELEDWKQTVRELTGTVNDLQARMNGADPSDPRSNSYYEDLTILEKYHRMTEEEREELLSGNASKRRAVLIFENWTEWATEVNAGWLISTNHTRGKNGRTAIAVDLEAATGEDLQAVEVYRAMRAVAKLSVRDPDDVEIVTDSYGREHITGGAFEFHEKVNPDANGRKRKYKILKLADENGVMLP